MVSDTKFPYEKKGSPFPPFTLKDMIFNNLTEYINNMDNETTWISYFSDTKKATITDLISFAKKFKKGTKKIGAYDQLDAEEDCKYDFAKTDKLGINVIERLKFYNPSKYIKNQSKVKYFSKIAKYWSIRSVIFQSDTSFTTEVNLMLALKENENVKNVDLEDVWEKEHIKAGRDVENAKAVSDWIRYVFNELDK